MLSLSWKRGNAFKIFAKLYKYIPLYIIQVLPYRLWRSTELKKASITTLNTKKPYPTSKSYNSEIDYMLKILGGDNNSLRLPLVNFELSYLKVIGKTLKAKDGNRIDGAILNFDNMNKKVEESSDISLSAYEKVERFFSNSSPQAQKLAKSLTAVPINLPIMRMIQEKVVGEKGNIYIAEVINSNLLIKDNEIFKYDEEVHNVLFKLLGREEALDIAYKNSDYIQENLHTKFSFKALLRGDIDLNKIEMSENDKVFASISCKILKSLGYDNLDKFGCSGKKKIFMDGGDEVEIETKINAIITLYKEDDLNVDLLKIVNYLNEICTYLTFKVGKETFALEEKKISWSESYKNLSSAIHKETKYSIGAFFFTKKAYNNNYFFEGNTHYKNLMIISFSGWNSLTTLPYSNAIAYFVAKVLSLDLSNYQHQESTGCLYDFSAKKDDIDKNMREAYICKDCYSRIEKNKSDKNMKILKDIENILEVVGRASIYDLDILNKNSLFMQNNIKLEYSWLKFLQEEFDKSYMKNLNIFLREEKRQGKKILPKASLWFNALNLTPINQVKVVILGQDPYPTIGYAHGLSFSVLPDVKPLPKSLLNINKELLDDLGIDNFHTGYLQPWTKQGVLLLNSVLTVEAGKSNSHQGKGWEIFTDKIIEVINRECNNIVFILWGSHAQKKGSVIDTTKHLIIKSPNPSPLSAYRGFFGSKPFSRTNSYLKKNNKQTINWNLDFNTLQCDELKQYTVKIEYQGIKGSGFIVKLDKFSNNFFVFTAKHIFESLDIDINEVLIQYEDEVITPREKISLETDMIVFIFDNSISQRISNLKLIPLSSNPNQFKESIFVGYSRDNLVCQKCIYSHALEKENLYTIKSTQQYNMQDIAGTSGSGLFIKENGQYSIVGIILQHDERMFNFKYIAISEVIHQINAWIEKILIESLDDILDNFFSENSFSEKIIFDDDRNTPKNKQMSIEIETKLTKLMNLLCFDIDTVEVDVFNEIAHIFIDGEDATLLIGKEGYRYNALFYMLFNWINTHYGLHIKLEIAEFIQTQEEMIENYLKPIIKHVNENGRGKTKPLDEISVQIALEQLRAEFPNKSISIKISEENNKKIITIDDLNLEYLGYSTIKFNFLKANSGEGIIVSTNNTNIIIDGGTAKTYQQELKLKVEKMNILDLVILTHRDNNNVGGLLKLIADDRNRKKIKELWFNGLFKENEVRKSIILSEKLIQTDNISYKKDIFLSEDNPNQLYQINDIHLELLSPIKQYKKYMQGKQDSSIENASSIAFILKHQNKQFLLLADSSIEIINYSLKRLGYSKTNRLIVDFVKLSHMGSIRNINTEFLDIVKSDTFVILTDGKRFNFPHKETLELILTHELRAEFIEFISNYEGVLESKLTEEEVKKYNCKLVYATNMEF